MRAFFSAPRKIDLGCSVSRFSSSSTIFKNFLNKNGKIKHAKSKGKTSVIVLQVFVFDKTYFLFLMDSDLVRPESTPSVHSRVHYFEVHYLMSCFPTTT